LLLFGVPFVVAEGGAFLCVLFAAMGHVVAGAVGYTAIKIVGFGLLAPIFDLTKPKLMTLPWFAVVYDKALVFHHFALGLDCAVPRRRAEAGRRALRPRPRAVDAPERGGERRGALTGARGAAAGSAL
jgi:hypothetical protein